MNLHAAADAFRSVYLGSRNLITPTFVYYMFTLRNDDWCGEFSSGQDTEGRAIYSLTMLRRVNGVWTSAGCYPCADGRDAMSRFLGISDD